MKIFFKTLLLQSILLLALISSAVNAQSPEEILNQMISQYSNSLDGIETMMTISTMEGFMATDTPDTTYYRKVTLEDGTQVLEDVNGDTPSANYWNLKENFDTVAENATYEGTENINGREAHVIFIEDVSALYGQTMGDVESGTQGEPQSGRFYVDVNDYVPLRMSFDVEYDGEYSGSVDVNMNDYRSVDGIQMAFLTEISMAGISDQFSAEELAEAREGMRELREQLENSSGMQKRIMERAIAPQLERMEKILEEGSMNMTVTILEAQTNVSIPE
jgi:hypothetical protein